MSAQRQSPGTRQHYARYNIDSDARRALRNALKALNEYREPLDVALQDSSGVSQSGAEVRRALRLIVDGPGAA
jgi:hypothetical protein